MPSSLARLRACSLASSLPAAWSAQRRASPMLVSPRSPCQVFVVRAALTRHFLWFCSGPVICERSRLSYRHGAAHSFLRATTIRQRTAWEETGCGRRLLKPFASDGRGRTEALASMRQMHGVRMHGVKLHRGEAPNLCTALLKMRSFKVASCSAVQKEKLEYAS